MIVEWKTFQPLVKNALRDLDTCDRGLLTIHVNERAVTHKLGEYLRSYIDPLFGETTKKAPYISVDCEYNRLDEEKDAKQLPWNHDVSVKDGGLYYTPNPDVAVHHRGDQKANLLVIEVKTHYFDKPTQILIDKMKLTGYLRTPTYYQSGLFLKLGVDAGGIVLTEAKLVTKESIAAGDAGAQSHLWEIGRIKLTNQSSKSKRPGFIDPDEELHEWAKGTQPEFEAAFGFRPVHDELKWK
ncbi:hypothetical protein [Limnoglobus roseus]|uniref:Uncharacterized protein n=1 Tax=Limnoglobus roseus TaxID=2598579 RepID=A0A5C1AKS6_9BACT|nr:hypothetical protein [Limnoglobus roseus]QEL18767.1 hypothetical protein PX52LOC_05805 [Limnoglobus roseus]